MLTLFPFEQHLARKEVGDAFEIVRQASLQNLIFLCPFGSSRVPEKIGSIDSGLEEHLLLDVNSEHFTQELCLKFDCLGIFSRFSRVFCDINSPPNSCIPTHIEDKEIQNNQNLDVETQSARIQK